MLRIVEYRAGGALLDNLAIIHERDTIGDLAREPEVPRVDVPLPPTRAEVRGSELIKDLPTLPDMVRHSRAA
jgi:hypothetical protein